MLKLFVFFGSLLIICSAQNPIEIAKSYCNTVNCPKGKSIACQYIHDANIKCHGGQLLQLDSSKIVNLHNDKRNIVALGKLPGFKPAVDMKTIQWSKELEQLAKYNVMTCKFQHDKCRNTNNFKNSGQNLYYEWRSNSGSDNINPNEIISNAIESWFDEYKDADMSHINSYHDSGEPIGHFTQLVRNDNGFVGCALNKMKFTTTNEVEFFLACNYQTTNFLYEPVYIAGPTGSKCTNGLNAKYPGLCK